jgi:hypothetical protein
VWAGERLRGPIESPSEPFAARLGRRKQREATSSEQFPEASIEGDEMLAQVRDCGRQPGIGHIVSTQPLVEA